MTGYAKIFTHKESTQQCYTGLHKGVGHIWRGPKNETRRRRTGESRRIELQKNLDKAGIRCKTEFGRHGVVIIRWGNHDPA